MNVVSLVGRLTKDIELRYTTSGTAVGTFTLAVNRQFTNASGEREADFINCVIWRKSAESLANFTSKGSQIGVTGRMQTRNYENQQGQRVYITEVVVDNFTLLEKRSESEQQNSASNQQSNGFNNQNQGFQGGAQNTTNNATTPNNSDPFAGGQELDISDDSLPF